MEYILIPALAIMNALRGRDIVPPVLFILFCAVLVTGYAWLTTTLELWQLGVLAVTLGGGITLWRQPGMDFACIHGRPPVRGKIPLLAWFADLFVKNPQTQAENRRWGFWWMTGRGLFAFPMFAALVWLNPYAPLLGLAMALQGPIYSAMRYHKSEPVWLAEALTGALLGLLLIITL